jgi:acyl phosphate:glycerol-3-phosphate acyltransferase
MPEIFKALPFILAAYLLGSIPTAYLVVRLFYKADIRKYGSGQVGGSNVFRSFSKPLGVTVGLYDGVKGLVVVLVAHLIGLSSGYQVLAGMAVIIGHNWPVFLRFNAGRGLATTVGVGLYLLPLGTPPFLFCAIFTLLVGSSPLPLLCSVATLPLASLALGKPVELTLGLTGLFAIMVVRRLTAPKTAGAAQAFSWELLRMRLLFDRDIKDGDTWITRKPIEKGSGKEQKKGFNR